MRILQFEFALQIRNLTPKRFTALPPDVVLSHAGGMDREATVGAVLGRLEVNPDSTLANLAVDSPRIVHTRDPWATGFVVAHENVSPGFKC